MRTAVDPSVLEQPATSGQPATFHLLDPVERVATVGVQGLSVEMPALYPTLDTHAFYACHQCMIEHHDTSILRAYAPKKADDGWPTHPWWKRSVALLLPSQDFEWVAGKTHVRGFLHDVPVIDRGVIVITDSLMYATFEREVPLLPFGDAQPGTRGNMGEMRHVNR